MIISFPHSHISYHWADFLQNILTVKITASKKDHLPSALIFKSLWSWFIVRAPVKLYIYNALITVLLVSPGQQDISSPLKTLLCAEFSADFEAVGSVDIQCYHCAFKYIKRDYYWKEVSVSFKNYFPFFYLKTFVPTNSEIKRVI